MNTLPTTDVAFVHHLADCQSRSIGARSRIWQFSVVLGGAKVGDDCNINAHCLIENDVLIGHRVTIKCGVYLWDGITLEDDVFIGPNATFTNDKAPRSKQYPEKFLRTTVKAGASVGAGTVILPALPLESAPWLERVL